MLLFTNYVYDKVVSPIKRLLASVFTTTNDQTKTLNSISYPMLSTSQSSQVLTFTSTSTSSISSSSSSIYFINLHTPTTTIKQPLNIKSTIINTLQQTLSYPSLNTTSSIILMAAPFLLDKFNLLSILQTNSILYMISFFRFNKNKKGQ